MYITPNTYVGNTGNSALWTLAATGIGAPTAIDGASTVTLDNTFNLAAGTTYGVAVSLSGGPGAASLYNTNGTGSNQFYSNADLSLTLGAASNTQWGSIFHAPRLERNDPLHGCS